MLVRTERDQEGRKIPGSESMFTRNRVPSAGDVYHSSYLAFAISRRDGISPGFTVQ